jgi:hypothetical protein
LEQLKIEERLARKAPRAWRGLTDVIVDFFETRDFRAAEQVYDRLIALASDQPMLKVQKASVISLVAFC